MSVQKIKSNMNVFGSAVLDKIRHHHLQFSNEDEIILHYRNDIKQSISGLKFIVSQMHRLSKNHWNKLFKTNLKICKQFIDLIGDNSLHFEDIEKYYHQFDAWQAEETVPLVHPKERQFLIESVNHQLRNYLLTIQQLRDRVVGEWDYHAESMKIRVGEMIGYLKLILQLIKKRNKKKSNYDKIHNKVDKLMKKTTELEPKERKQLEALDHELLEAGRIFTRIDEKLKAILPHSLSLLEEFVENITKITFCKQLDLYQDIDASLRYFGEFQGLLDTKEKAPHIPQLDKIEDLWNEAVTPTRLQIESFISIIHNKRPELLDTEIDDQDKTLKLSNAWTKVTNKVVDKNHVVKAKDEKNGIFTDYLEADALQSFEKFNNPKYNISETYHPHKIIKADDITPPQAAAAAPPLPPRTNTARKVIPQFHNGPPVPRRHNSQWFVPAENDSDSDSASISSASSISSLSSVSSLPTESTMRDYDHNKNVSKLYNSAKNEITEAPITAELPDLGHHRVPANITERLILLSAYFAKLVDAADGTTKTAKFDFDGVEPGDLSFRKGDVVSIAYDLGTSKWLVGYLKGKDDMRVGFVPSNYF
ncbi:hypothetical protein QFC19_006582 [Naganishia cerealis]|uniref:Uncharacterized protein n=1 Tax=Naganishia cerealis TaxID=610337 RepID=A0ACC2VG46_9TREE|nr:hypothetical protein QFC19_006582 [Naganishia cerealis]